MGSDILSNSFTLEMLNKEIEKKKIINFLKTADLGIEDIILEKEDVKTIHRVYDSDNNITGNIEFDFNFESEGTKKFLTLAGPIIDALENGKVLVIDELSSKLHYQLSDYIVRLFNSIDKNKNNAQLIFNSHLPLFLDNKEFRKDQIWFVEKDKFGKSKLYSLYDINVRKDLSYMKSYLLGKFGALPEIKEL